MIIGVPKETKTREYRVGMTPAGVRQLVAHGSHRARRERAPARGAGSATSIIAQAGRGDRAGGGRCLAAEMVVKVKEPQAAEYGFFRDGLILYTYLHLAAEPDAHASAGDRRGDGVAYETIQLDDGSLPLLAADERSRRAHGGAGRRHVPGERARRQRRARSAACPAPGAVAW